MSKPLIGRRAEARRLLDYVLANTWADQDAVQRKLLDSGWEFIGAGCYRSAFLSPSGVVYKVEDDTYCESNKDEIRRARALARKSLSADIVIPVVSGFTFKSPTGDADRPFKHTVIVAMQYMAGEHPPGCWYDSFEGRTFCECGEIEYNEKGEPDKFMCSYSELFARLRKELDSCDIHNENVIEMFDGRFAVIDLQM